MLYGCTSEKDTTGSINGIVSNELEFELQRAKMMLSDNAGRKEVTETGSDGRYEFQNLTLGEIYTIKAELKGYYTDSLVTVISKKETRGDFVLKEIALRLSKTVIDCSINDYADFVIYNDSQRDMVWTADINVSWLSFSKTSGVIKAKSAEPIHVTIDRSKIPENSSGTEVIINSSHEYAELSVKISNNIDNDLYIELKAAGIAVQRKDINTTSLNWNSLNSLCENSIVGGFTDWRLPTKDELAIIFNERDVIGGFNNNGFYFSSTYGVNSGYWGISFNTGYFSYGSSNSSLGYARAVRSLH
jgi:hypothetical protein